MTRGSPDNRRHAGAGDRDADGPSPERVARYHRGRWSEVVAAMLLRLKGYRILARRHRTPFGEIDLIARRGRRLAFVEVKQRATEEEAQTAVTPRQQDRIARAAAHWVSRHPRYREHEHGLDVVLLVPGRWPLHMANAYMPSQRLGGGR